MIINRREIHEMAENQNTVFILIFRDTHGYFIRISLVLLSQKIEVLVNFIYHTKTVP